MERMTAEKLKEILDTADIAEAQELLEHSPWVTLRWFTRDPVRDPPEVYGPFDTPAEALTCADVLDRQLKSAPMYEGPNDARGVPVVLIAPAFTDYGEAP